MGPSKQEAGWAPGLPRALQAGSPLGPQAAEGSPSLRRGCGADLRPLGAPALETPRRGAGRGRPGAWTAEQEDFQNSLQIRSFGSPALPAPLTLPPPLPKKKKIKKIFQGSAVARDL